jgi:hypothetical protein
MILLKFPLRRRGIDATPEVIDEGYREKNLTLRAL